MDWYKVTAAALDCVAENDTSRGWRQAADRWSDSCWAVDLEHGKRERNGLNYGGTVSTRSHERIECKKMKSKCEA